MSFLKFAMGGHCDYCGKKIRGFSSTCCSAEIDGICDYKGRR